jgi:hypothetical protein
MTSPLRSLTAPATARIRALVLGVFLCGRSGIDYDAHAGDAGLFGPDSITWRIPCMLSGGLCALMLQCSNTPYDIAQQADKRPLTYVQAAPHPLPNRYGASCTDEIALFLPFQSSYVGYVPSPLGPPVLLTTQLVPA